MPNNSHAARLINNDVGLAILNGRRFPYTSLAAGRGQVERARSIHCSKMRFGDCGFETAVVGLGVVGAFLFTPAMAPAGFPLLRFKGTSKHSNPNFRHRLQGRLLSQAVLRLAQF